MINTKTVLHTRISLYHRWSSDEGSLGVKSLQGDIHVADLSYSRPLFAT
jgi:hypothetical protein